MREGLAVSRYGRAGSYRRHLGQRLKEPDMHVDIITLKFLVANTLLALTLIGAAVALHQLRKQMLEN